ncbi:MAG: hypothetical protein ACE5EZ_02415 [Thermodesulfobacteriota bacterium]
MITANIYEIIAFLLAAAFLILIIFAIPALLQIKKTAKSVEDLTTESRKSLEALNNLIKTTGDKAGELDGLFKRLSELSTRLSATAEMIGGNIKGPLITLLSLIIGLQYGFKYFMDHSQEGKEKEGEGGGENVKGQE